MTFRLMLVLLFLAAVGVGGCSTGSGGGGGGGSAVPDDSDNGMDDPVDGQDGDGADGDDSDGDDSDGQDSDDPGDGVDEPPPDDSMDGPEPLNFGVAFDTSQAGALSAVWGSSDDDIFVVGGTPEQGEVYHYDGTEWQPMVIPAVPMLNAVFGFSTGVVYAVGLQGTVIAFDRTSWTALYAGTGEDLWGIWGDSRDDIWIVGGNVGEEFADIIHFDGRTTFTHQVASNSDRSATALFKVWGMGETVFAVGEKGLILQFNGRTWDPVALEGPIADEDFLALWGTREDRIVAVGGRSSGLIAIYDGTQWTVTKPADVPGLNTVYLVQDDVAVVGGLNGYVASYVLETAAVMPEDSNTDMTIQGSWADENGQFFLVGGRFDDPFQGVALVSGEGDPGDDPDDPVDPPMDNPPECESAADCAAGETCVEGMCQPVMAEIELGFGNPFVSLPEGGDMPVALGFQGLGELYLSYRTVGFTPGGTATVTIEVTLVQGGTIVVPRQTIPGASFMEAEPGVNEKLDDFWLVTSNPVAFFDKEATVMLTITDDTNPAITGTLEQNVIIVNANEL